MLESLRCRTRVGFAAVSVVPGPATPMVPRAADTFTTQLSWAPCWPVIGRHKSPRHCHPSDGRLSPGRRGAAGPFSSFSLPRPCPLRGQAGRGLPGRSWLCGVGHLTEGHADVRAVSVALAARTRLQVPKQLSPGRGPLRQKRTTALPRVPGPEPCGDEPVCLSSRCFVCRQSKQQLEDEQKQALYGLENTGNAPDTRPPPAVQLQAAGPSRPHPRLLGRDAPASPLVLVLVPVEMPSRGGGGGPRFLTGASPAPS